VLEHETIDGAEVNRLIAVGRGEIADDGSSHSAESRNVVERSRANGESAPTAPAGVPSGESSEASDTPD
jgi:hypothetical protein